MSEFWDMYKKKVAEGADKLSKPPKDVSQNILWLKAYATEKLGEILYKNRGTSMYVGKSGDNNSSFGFKEEFVNYLMHYAFEAGLKSKEMDYKKATKNMTAALDKIKDTLDDIGWIDYPESY
jgi:ribosomal protein L27